MKLLKMTVATLALTAGSAFAAAHSTAMIDADNVKTDGATATFANVMASSDGYLVLHNIGADGNVVAPASIGHVAVKKGENTNVKITADAPLKGGASYIAMLHDETNGNTSYDFAEGMTDADTPTMMDDKPVVEKFTVAAMSGSMESSMDKMSDMMPMVDVKTVTINGDTARFGSITAGEDGYVVIHTMLDGAPVIPASIGHSRILAGENKDVTVTIDYDFVDGETYMAMLHTETNGNGTYEFGIGMTDVDGPVMVDGKLAADVFSK